MNEAYKDFEGNQIYKGDVLKHTDGTTFIVDYYGHLEVGRWRAVYKDGVNLWLGNQVTKGQAVRTGENVLNKNSK